MHMYFVRKLHTVLYFRFNPEVDAIMADPPKNPKKLLHEHFQVWLWNFISNPSWLMPF